jgi:hypothetical protein
VERLAGELGQLTGRADGAGEGAGGQVEREAEVVPGARLQSAHLFETVAVAHEQRVRRDAELDGGGDDRALADVEAIRRAAGRGVEVAEVEVEVQRLGVCRRARRHDRLPQAVARLAAADADAAGSGGVDVDVRALRFREHRVRSGGEPGLGRGLAGLLKFEGQVRPAHARRRPRGRGAFAGEGRELRVDLGDLPGAFRFEPLLLGRRREGDEVDRVLRLLAARERVLRAGEDAVEAVVVVGRDGVVLVVVAAGAADRQPEDGPAENFDRVGDVEVAERVGAGVVAEPLGDGDEPCGDHPVAVQLRRSVAGDEIPGHLFAQEHVVRLVVVERADHPVAVLVRLADRVVGAVAGGVRVADHVEPVPPPALPVMRRREQALDHACERVRVGVVDERRDLLGRGRQAGQVERCPPDQRPPVGRAVGAEAVRFQLGEDEPVDVTGGPRRVGDRRRGGRRHGLQ